MKYNTAWAGQVAEERDQLEMSLQPWLFGPVEHTRLDYSRRQQHCGGWLRGGH
jgi:hypothetical protein